MAKKLVFRYGAMGASKTANALMVRYNYSEKGMKAILLKPACEMRDGEKILRSRIGLSAECNTVEEFFKNPDYSVDCIIVDEAQFLSAGDIDRLSEIVDKKNITVICYGLRTDFQSHFFEGSRRLMEIADNIEEVPTICWCGKKARFNARIDKEGKIVRTGEQFKLGSNDQYVSLCRKHYRDGKIM